MFLKLTHFLIFQFCKIITRYKNISDINHFDFNTFPSSKIELKKHVENGIFRNSNFNKNIQELKIRGNENVILSISSFSWLFLFSALNTHSTRKNTEYLFKKSKISNFNFNYPDWKTDISGYRLLALSLNNPFLRLTNLFSNKKKMAKFIYMHVLYLSICKMFLSRGLLRLRINMGIFFSSFLLREKFLKRNSILKDILNDLDKIFSNIDKIRNSSDLLEILFFMNRIIKFSSTSDLSNGRIDKKIKLFLNIICPLIRGLSIGNNLLVRSHYSSGCSIYCELEKELSDAETSDFSTMKNPNGFIRIKSGHLTFLFDEKKELEFQYANDFMCSGFSFELASNNNTIMQNNSSFYCHIGKSDQILFLRNQMNTLGLSVESNISNIFDLKSKIVEVSHHRDFKNDYIEAEKIISFDKKLVFYKRKISISFSGREIIGKEIISLNQTFEKSHFFYLPFHIHPEIELWKSDQLGNFLLKSKNNEIWRFETDQKNAVLEDYDFLDPLSLEIKNAYRIVFFNNFHQKLTTFNWKLYL